MLPDPFQHLGHGRRREAFLLHRPVQQRRTGRGLQQFGDRGRPITGAFADRRLGLLRRRGAGRGEVGLGRARATSRASLLERQAAEQGGQFGLLAGDRGRLFQRQQLVERQGVGRPMRQLRDPIVDQCEAAGVDGARPNVRHVPRSQLRHAEEQCRAIRIARGDQLGIVDAKGPLGRADADRPRLGQRQLLVELHIRRAPAPKPVAMGTLHVQVRPRPLIERLGRMEGVGQPGGEGGLLPARQFPGSPLREVGLAIGVDQHPQLLQRSQLIARFPLPLMIAIELRQVERQQVLGPRVVTPQAVGAGRKLPGQLPHSPGGVRVADLQHPAVPRGIDQLGIGLLVIPAVRIAPPVPPVEMQDLRLDGSRCFDDPVGERQRQCLHQHRVGRELGGPLEHRVRNRLRAGEALHHSVAGQTEKPLRRGPVGPQFGVDLEGEHAGRGSLPGDIGVNARPTELAGKRRVGRRGVGGLQLVDRPGVVVEQVQLARVVFRKVDNPHRRFDNFATRGRLRIARIDTPDAAGFPIAKQVQPPQFGEAFPPVNKAPGDRGPLGVRNLDGRGDDRAGAAGPLGMHWLPPFKQAPAKVVGLVHLVDQFPEFPTHIAHPQFTRLAVETHLPRIAETVGPDFAAGIGQIHKRIVGRDGVGASLVGTSHIDPQNGREQVRNILPGLQRVGRKGGAAISRGDVQAAIGTKLQAAPVVAPLQPRDQQLLAGGVGGRRLGRRDFQPNDARPLGVSPLRSILPVHHVTEVAEAAGGEVGREGEAVDRFELDRVPPGGVELRHQLGRVEKELRLAPLAIAGQRVDLPRLLGDEEPVGARCRGEHGRILERRLRVNPPGAERDRRFRTTAEVRGGPRGAGERFGQSLGLGGGSHRPAQPPPQETQPQQAQAQR